MEQREGEEASYGQTYSSDISNIHHTCAVLLASSGGLCVKRALALMQRHYSRERVNYEWSVWVLDCKQTSLNISADVCVHQQKSESPLKCPVCSRRIIFWAVACHVSREYFSTSWFLASPSTDTKEMSTKKQPKLVPIIKCIKICNKNVQICRQYAVKVRLQVQMRSDPSVQKCSVCSAS